MRTVPTIFITLALGAATTVAPAVATAAVAPAADSAAMGPAMGMGRVYALTNDPMGNAVVAYKRQHGHAHDVGHVPDRRHGRLAARCGGGPHGLAGSARCGPAARQAVCRQSRQQYPHRLLDDERDAETHADACRLTAPSP